MSLRFANATARGMIASLIREQTALPFELLQLGDEITIVVFGPMSAGLQGLIYDTLMARIHSVFRVMFRFFPEAGNVELREAVEAAYRLDGHRGVAKLVAATDLDYVRKCTCTMCEA